MIVVGMAAARRSMRRHQGIPPRRPRLPLWRLLLGEAAWALRELVGEPRVLAALLVGFATTIALLDAAAPGPVLPWPGRVVAGLLVGLALARGVAAWLRRRARTASGDPVDGASAIAATEVVAFLVALVLLAWIAAWAVTVLT